MSPEAAPELSIIIPAYNEELRLPATLSQIAAYIRSSKRAIEVIVVDDGSRDNTVAVAEQFRSEIPTLRVVSNGENRGKGYSVRHGMQVARGDIVLFTDADLSAPIEEVEKLLPAMKTNQRRHRLPRHGSQSDYRSRIAIPRVRRNRLQQDRSPDPLAALCGHPVRLQSLPPRPLQNHFRAADHRSLRLRPRAAIPGASPRPARRRNLRALGPLPSHESEA